MSVCGASVCGVLLVSCGGLSEGGADGRSGSDVELKIARIEGHAPIIDGLIETGEWSSATELGVAFGVSARVVRGDGRLFVLVRGLPETDGVVSVGVAKGDRVWVLHSSQALGTAEYRRKAGAAAWVIERRFEWACREPAATVAGQREREKHFGAEGWSASTAVDRAQDREIVIDGRFADEAGTVRLAIAIFAPGAVFPASLADGMTDRGLQMGEAVQTLKFETSAWYSIEL